MTRIPALVVGTGFGCRIHVPALRAAGFEVVGLVGTKPERLREKADKLGIPNTFTSLDEAIRMTGAQAVSIATTPHTHAPLSLIAIEHGCHVLCEKPFAINAAEGRRVLEAAEQAGIVHLVAHEFRYQSERALMGQVMADGVIGEPRFLVLDQFLPMSADPKARMTSWWFDNESGGGWLGANGSHIIDQVRAWFGDFESLSAHVFSVAERDSAASADDSYSVRFRMKNGVEGSMQQSVGAWGEPFTVWRCAGTKGTVWLDRGKVMLADQEGTREVPMPENLALPPITDMRTFELGAFTRLAEVFHARISNTTPPTSLPPATFHDGLACMEVMDKMRQSSAQSGALQTV